MNNVVLAVVSIVLRASKDLTRPDFSQRDPCDSFGSSSLGLISARLVSIAERSFLHKVIASTDGSQTRWMKSWAAR